MGIAVREYQTDIGPADYVLFVDKKPVGIIEAKRIEEGIHLNYLIKIQSERLCRQQDRNTLIMIRCLLCMKAQVKYPVLLITVIPKPRSRPVFSFHRPETFH